ncbi:hypothetical protein KY314_02930 [Candidatus Woesearchaeota archaeon]|nr:hypothetical protein [Candidatus Woesearchaeota archaeon]
MLSSTQTTVIIASSCVSFIGLLIKNRLKKIDDSYEKLKNECDSKISRRDLNELLSLYLEPLSIEIKNIRDTINKIVIVKTRE